MRRFIAITFTVVLMIQTVVVWCIWPLLAYDED